MAHDNVISFDPHSEKEKPRKLSLDANSRRAVDEMRDVVRVTLPKLLQGVFEKLDDALFKHAGNAETNEQYTIFVDAWRDLRKARSRIAHRFEAECATAFNQFWINGPGDIRLDAPGAEDLSLLAEEDLEESLAVSTMTSKAEMRFDSELYAMEQRFALMTGIETVGNNNNPIAPYALGIAFERAIESVEVAFEVRLIIYKLFDTEVLSYVGGLYDEINDLLIRFDILPRLKRHSRRNPVSPAIDRSRQDPEVPAAALAPAGSAPSPGEPQLQAELFRTLRELLASQRGQGGSALPRYDSYGIALPVVETNEVLDALTHLQSSGDAQVSVQSVDTSESPDLRMQLLLELRISPEHASRTISEADEDCIDVVSMLFEFVLEDKNIADSMKALIRRLQIPILKVALMDKTFFNKKLHPARRLLNNMAQAAVGWLEGEDRGANSLYGIMESIVNRVMSEFRHDAGIFVDLDDEFRQYLDKLEEGTQIAEERQKQARRGKDQLAAAKVRVAEEINQRLRANDNLPAVVVGLLHQGWKDVLLLTYLRRGESSAEWSQALKVADQLIWSVGAKKDNLERQKLLRIIPELLTSIRQGLTNISFDQHKMTQVFKDLQACHIKSLKKPVDETPGSGGELDEIEDELSRTDPGYGGVTIFDDAGEPIADADTEIVITVDEDSIGIPELKEVAPRHETPDQTGTDSLPGISELEMDDAYDEQTSNDDSDIFMLEDEQDSTADSDKGDEFFAAARALDIGAWVEFDHGNGQLVRAKLSWKSDISDTYVFVNRKGQNVAEMNLAELAHCFRENVVEPVKDVDVSTSDNALTELLKSLKKQRSDDS